MLRLESISKLLLLQIMMMMMLLLLLFAHSVFKCESSMPNSVEKKMSVILSYDSWKIGRPLTLFVYFGSFQIQILQKKL